MFLRLVALRQPGAAAGEPAGGGGGGAEGETEVRGGVDQPGDRGPPAGVSPGIMAGDTPRL